MYTDSVQKKGEIQMNELMKTLIKVKSVVMHLVSKDERLLAIILVKSITGWNLFQSKTWVDMLYKVDMFSEQESKMALIKAIEDARGVKKEKLIDMYDDTKYMWINN